MSDKKMIIRNCPAFDSKYNECHSKIEPHKLYCMDCTDCVLKQIVKDCNKFRQLQDGDAINVGQSYAGLAILQQIEIEECE